MDPNHLNGGKRAFLDGREARVTPVFAGHAHTADSVKAQPAHTTAGSGVGEEA